MVHNRSLHFLFKVNGLVLLSIVVLLLVYVWSLQVLKIITQISCLLHYPNSCRCAPASQWIQDLQQSTICTNPSGKVSLLSIFLLPIELVLGYFVHTNTVGLLLITLKQNQLGRRR